MMHSHAIIAMTIPSFNQVAPNLRFYTGGSFGCDQPVSGTT